LSLRTDDVSDAVLPEVNPLLKRSEISAELKSSGTSEMTGMLLRLTVSAREIRVIPNVALSIGSSQQGNARLAAVGYHDHQTTIQIDGRAHTSN
jgi:hypothetical protein